MAGRGGFGALFRERKSLKLMAQALRVVLFVPQAHTSSALAGNAAAAAAGMGVPHGSGGGIRSSGSMERARSGSASAGAASASRARSASPQPEVPAAACQPCGPAAGAGAGAGAWAGAGMITVGQVEARSGGYGMPIVPRQQVSRVAPASAAAMLLPDKLCAVGTHLANRIGSAAAARAQDNHAQAQAAQAFDSRIVTSGADAGAGCGTDAIGRRPVSRGAAAAAAAGSIGGTGAGAGAGAGGVASKEHSRRAASASRSRYAAAMRP